MRNAECGVRTESFGRRRAPRLLATLLLLVIALGALPAHAAPLAQANNGVNIQVHAGFGDDGSYMMGAWFPVRVTLTNPAGGTPGRVSVEVDSSGNSDQSPTGTYSREVDLPNSSRKEVTLYAYSGNFTRSVTVRLVRDGTIIGSASASITPFEQQSSVLIGVASSDPSLLNPLRDEVVGHVTLQSQPSSPYPSPSGSGKYNATALIAHIALSDIPALSVGLDSLGALVFDDVDTGPLSAEQRQSLAAWVERGGTLIAVLRPGGADVAGGLADLLPVSPGGARGVTSLDSLAALVDASPPAPDPILVFDVTLRPQAGVPPRVLASEGGVPLLAVRDLGRGQIVYMALSPGLQPLKSWDGTLPLLKRLLAEHSTMVSFSIARRFTGGPNFYYTGSGMFGGRGIFALPGLDLPDPLLLGLFLVVYIMIIGPINFFVLRRLRRTELAWITIPALIALFSVAAYVLAYQSKGGDLTAIRGSVVETVPGGPVANNTQFLGLFSPVRRTYSLSLGADSAVTEINTFGFGSDQQNSSRTSGGNPTTVNGVVINTWSLRGFMAENSVSAQFPLEADLHLGNNLIEGTVRNRTDQPLQDVALVRGAAVQYIGYIAPGQRAEVKLLVTRVPFSTKSPTDVLPAPKGVVNPAPYYSSSGPQDSPEQRAYERKLSMLEMGLFPLLSQDPEAGMDVLALAWGQAPASSFNIDGYSTRYEESNLWTGRVPVAGGSAQSRLPAGSSPLVVYAPGNGPAWVPIVPSSATDITVDPHADLLFQLPAGTRPQTLSLGYSLKTFSGQLDVTAYNVRTGSWDKVGSLGIQQASNVQGTGNGTLSIPNPADYTGDAGDVTLRLRYVSGDRTVSFSDVGLALNDKP